jgi:hypothetical protein
MKRLARIAIAALPLLMLAAAPAYADVKTRDKTTVKFEGMLGRMYSLFGGKGAKEGVEGLTALKGTRKATMNDTSGQIIDLAEEKIYDLDVKKKTYTVVTFEELRRKMREAQEKAKTEVQKQEPGRKEEPQKPTKEYEIDFDVKDTGQKKPIAGFDTHQSIVTITVREKGKTLDEAGGVVMTNDIWLAPRIPQLKELADFEAKYWKQLQGPEVAAMSAEQMASMLAMFPLAGKAMERMQKDGDKLAGTPLDTTTTFESVLSKDQLTEAQANSSSSKGSGGGLGGMLAKKIMKQEAPKSRSTIVTMHHEVLEITPSAAAGDVAIPADFKEKK